jgi:bacterioferritin
LEYKVYCFDNFCARVLPHGESQICIGTVSALFNSKGNESNKELYVRIFMNTAKYSPEEIRQAIEQGPITSEYRADPQELIVELNRLRATEIASYLQYKQHSYMAVSLLAPGLKGDFETHATLELEHADVLAQRIQQLGGVPVFSPREIAAQAAQEGVQPEQGSTLTDMVTENLFLERRQVMAYTALIRQVGDTDPTTRRLLVDILAVTEQHASELADYLKRSADTRS